MNTNKYITTSYRRLSKILVLLNLVFWITSSCKSDEEQEKIIINPLTAIEREVRLSEFTNDITYIPLDNKILFQHPNRIETTKDHFIMATFPGNILCFDRNGNFINEIGSRGRGPGEYRTGLYFTIDPKDELVYIYDNRIITYTFN